MKNFGGQSQLVAANSASLRTGYNYADTAELFNVQHTVAPARCQGALPAGDGQRGGGVGTGGGRPSCRADAGLCQLSDYARQRDPARAVEVQGIRRRHDPDRGRDRRLRRCPGASFGGAIGADRHQPAGTLPEGRNPGPGGDGRVAAGSHQRAASGPSTGMPTKTDRPTC